MSLQSRNSNNDRFLNDNVQQKFNINDNVDFHCFDASRWSNISLRKGVKRSLSSPHNNNYCLGVHQKKRKLLYSSNPNCNPQAQLQFLSRSQSPSVNIQRFNVPIFNTNGTILNHSNRHKISHNNINIFDDQMNKCGSNIADKTNDSNSFSLIDSTILDEIESIYKLQYEDKQRCIKQEMERKVNGARIEYETQIASIKKLRNNINKKKIFKSKHHGDYNINNQHVHSCFNPRTSSNCINNINHSSIKNNIQLQRTGPISPKLSGVSNRHNAYIKPHNFNIRLPEVKPITSIESNLYSTNKRNNNYNNNNNKSIVSINTNKINAITRMWNGDEINAAPFEQMSMQQRNKLSEIMTELAFTFPISNMNYNTNTNMESITIKPPSFVATSQRS